PSRCWDDRARPDPSSAVLRQNCPIVLLDRPDEAWAPARPLLPRQSLRPRGKRRLRRFLRAWLSLLWLSTRVRRAGAPRSSSGQAAALRQRFRGNDIAVSATPISCARVYTRGRSFLAISVPTHFERYARQ